MLYRFDLATREPKKLYDYIDDAEHINHKSWQVRDLLLAVRPEKDTDKQKRDAVWYRSILEARDLITNKSLCERKLYEGQNKFSYTGQAVVLQISGWPGIRAAAKDDPVLDERMKAIDDKHDAYVLQVVDPLSGKYLGSVLIDTGKKSFEVTSSRVFGDTVFVSDSLERTIICSLSTGAQKGKLLGGMLAANPAGSRVMVLPHPAVVDLFDTATLRPLAHFSFPAGSFTPISLPMGRCKC